MLVETFGEESARRETVVGPNGQGNWQKPWDSATARLASQKGNARLKEQRERRKEERAASLLEAATDLGTDGTISAWASDEERLFWLKRAFPKPWDGLYQKTYRGLRRQYVVGTDRQQYNLLVQATAVVWTHLKRLEAEKGSLTLQMSLQDRFKSLVQALQKYTEAEQRILTVESDAVLKTLERVISLAESTIPDPQVRSAFFRAIQESVSGRQRAQTPQRPSNGASSLPNETTSYSGGGSTTTEQQGAEFASRAPLRLPEGRGDDVVEGEGREVDDDEAPDPP